MNTETSKLSQLEKLKRQKEVLEARIQKAEALHKERGRKEKPDVKYYSAPTS